MGLRHPDVPAARLSRVNVPAWALSRDPDQLVSGDDDGKTAKSVRRGVRADAKGCYAVSRNPASHDQLPEVDEPIAIEHLAALFVLARFVDKSTVLTA